MPASTVSSSRCSRSRRSPGGTRSAMRASDPAFRVDQRVGAEPLDLGPLGHPDHLRVSWLGRRDDRVSPRRPSPGNRCFLSARGGPILSGHEVPFHVAATRFWELMRIARWHVEGEAYDRALSMVVAAQAALPMAAFLGHGAERLQRWPVLPGRRPGEAPQPGQRPGTGTEPGVKAYFARLRPVLPVRHADHPATVHEAPSSLRTGS